MKALLSLVSISLFATFSFAQTAPAPAPAPAAAASATATKAVTIPNLDFSKLGNLSVKVGTATGTLSIEPIPVEVGPVKKPETTKKVSKASFSKTQPAKAEPPANGRLVIMKCDGTFSVVLTEERGTVVRDAHNCTPAVMAPREIRVIPAPGSAVALSPEAAPSVSAPHTSGIDVTTGTKVTGLGQVHYVNPVTGVKTSKEVSSADEARAWLKEMEAQCDRDQKNKAEAEAKAKGLKVTQAGCRNTKRIS